MASTNDTSTTQADEQATLEVEGDGLASPQKAPRKAAKKAARKRATSTTSAARAAEASESNPSEGPVRTADEEQRDPEPAATEVPAKKATRKRASRKVVAASAEAEESAGDSSPAPARRRTRAGAKTASPAGAAGGGGEVADGHPDQTETSEQASGADDASGTFGVLFQAPAPTRSRRATAPVAQPAVAAGAMPDAEGLSSDHQPARDDRDEQSGGEPSADEDSGDGPRRRRRRGGKGRRGRGSDADTSEELDSPDQPAPRKGRRGVAANSTGDAGSDDDRDDGAEKDDVDDDGAGGSRRRTRRRRRSGSSGDGDDAPGVVTRVREPRRERDRDEVTGLKGSTRLEAKKQRRREGREAGRRRTIITEAEFLARRESVERVMVVRTKQDRTQIAVLEDDVLVEHYISRETNVSMAGNIYLGRVQNVLPSMEAAFVDIGKGRNAVLYAGEVNWDAAGMEANQPKRIENALSSGESVLVQVTKDPIGHKGARLTSQISLPGRYLVYVPNSSMTGISRKLPDTERTRLKKILKEVVPDSAGVIVRTAAEGASEAELRADVERLTATWDEISAKADRAGKGKGSGSAPLLLHGEPDLTVRVIRDVFNEDFASLVVAGQQAWDEVSEYVSSVAPDLAERITRWTSEEDLFAHYRVDEQIAKAMDRKVWLPSGGSLVIDRTEAMTVVDVNTGKFVGSGGNLEETVTKNNIEAAEELVRQLRLRDIGGIIVVDFIDMVLEANRDLVVRRLLECLGRDRTKHQVAEVTSLGLVQMTRKRVGSGLIEVFGETCEHCNGRGIIIHSDPVDRGNGEQGGGSGASQSQSRGSGSAGSAASGRGGTRGRRDKAAPAEQPAASVRPSGPTPAQIAAAAHAAALKSGEPATVAARVAQEAHGQAEVDARQDGPVAPDQPQAPQDDGLSQHDQAWQDEQPNDESIQTPDGSDQSADRADQSPDRADFGWDRPEPAAQLETPDTHAQAQPDEPPAAAPRSRRRRGRVVAPAGPPGGGAALHTVE